MKLSFRVIHLIVSGFVVMGSLELHAQYNTYYMTKCECNELIVNTEYGICNNILSCIDNTTYDCMYSDGVCLDPIEVQFCKLITCSLTFSALLYMCYTLYHMIELQLKTPMRPRAYRTYRTFDEFL